MKLPIGFVAIHKLTRRPYPGRHYSAGAKVFHTGPVARRSLQQAGLDLNNYHIIEVFVTLPKE